MKISHRISPYRNSQHKDEMKCKRKSIHTKHWISTVFTITNISIRWMCIATLSLRSTLLFMSTSMAIVVCYCFSFSICLYLFVELNYRGRFIKYTSFGNLILINCNNELAMYQKETLLHKLIKIVYS